MFTAAAKSVGLDYKELRIALQGVLRKVCLYLPWTSALLLNIAARLDRIQQTTYEKEQYAQCVSIILMQSHILEDKKEVPAYSEESSVNSKEM